MFVTGIWTAGIRIGVGGGVKIYQEVSDGGVQEAGALTPTRGPTPAAASWTDPRQPGRPILSHPRRGDQNPPPCSVVRPEGNVLFFCRISRSIPLMTVPTVPKVRYLLGSITDHGCAFTVTLLHGWNTSHLATESIHDHMRANPFTIEGLPLVTSRRPLPRPSHLHAIAQDIDKTAHISMERSASCSLGCFVLMRPLKTLLRNIRAAQLFKQSRIKGREPRLKNFIITAKSRKIKEVLIYFHNFSAFVSSRCVFFKGHKSPFLTRMLVARCWWLMGMP